MFDTLKEWIVKTVKSRLFVLWIVIIVIFLIVIQRLFTLQIIKGDEYLKNYTMSIEKDISIEGTRGKIYDRNGVLLAYNELSYTVTLEDNGTYANNKERSQKLNEEINSLIDLIEKNGDSIINTLNLYMDKKGNLSYLLDEGTQLQRFRADVYGRSKISDLKVNQKLKYNEATATPEQMYQYLLDKFAINAKNTTQYDHYRAYQIMVVRYALYQNSFQKYISTNIAEDVSDETVAVIKEHADELQGVEVKEDTKRVYNHPEYFSHIIGYTGKISTDEYNDLKEQDSSYTLTDMVGKSGIEQYMETQLQGKKGSETVYVNNVGKVLKVKSHKDSSAGNDVYLSIDSKLQTAVYKMLEQELAGILYTKIVNQKTDSSSDLNIPIYDVYNALIENSVIDLDKMAAAKSGTYQADVYQTFKNQQKSSLQKVKNILENKKASYKSLSDEMQEYMVHIVTMLQDKGVFDKSAVDSSDDIYNKWKKGTISTREYLEHAIDASWIDVSAFDLNEKYADTTEIYDCLVSYIMEQLKSDSSFDKIVYKYLIMNDKISGRQLCVILYEQGVLKKDKTEMDKLKNGYTSAYSFLKSKIKNLELTPAQLALDPCSGSCIIMKPGTGEVLACVSYPGYDNNKLTNSMDSSYYNKLLNDKSLPLYDNATQQTTAPGSTYKMVSTAAGLTEGVISPDTIIEDKGVFTKLGLKLRCWVYPSNHGKINAAQAIRDSCNYFFGEVGYRLSMKNGKYNEQQGLDTLKKYATMFGFADKTKIEIPESSSKIADEIPIDATIGQSNNAYTTAQLARYVSALANKGTVYNLTLLNKVTDSEGKTLKTYKPKVKNTVTALSDTTWKTIQTGMREAIGEHDQFKDLKVELAGKTGTAQEDKTRPNHALFVGYAPYKNPEIAIATRIAHGYGSSNACVFVNNVMRYYFKEESAKKLINGKATNVGSSANRLD